MPARLAVGLGLESGPVIPLPEPLRPVLKLFFISRILGLPRPASGRKPDLGCNAQTKTQPPDFVKSPSEKAVFIEKTFANRGCKASYL
jgi:hypothetical protein